MALERKDRVKDQTSTTGTGPVTIDGVAPTGYRTITSVHTTGADLRYTITNATGSEWEVGQGIWTTSTNVLTRSTVFASSNSGGLVNFSAGVKTVFTGPTATDINEISATYAPLSNAVLTGDTQIASLTIAKAVTSGQGTAQLFRSGVSGGSPAASGTTDANQIGFFGAGSVQTSFGAYANGDAWIQQRSGANFATNYGIGINPNGGRIFLGGALQEFKVAIAASDINLSLGNYFTRTVSTTTTLTVSNTPATGTAASFILDLTNGGAATVNWWSGVKWAGGTAPTLTASGRDVLGFFTHDGGTTWTGLVLGKDVK